MHPGCPRAHKVHLAVKKLAITTDIKNLVVHFGTNHTPHQSPIQICRELTDHLERLQLALPDTHISFSTILLKISKKYNRGLNFINAYMDDVCADMGLGFIQHSSFSEHGLLNKRLYSPSEWKDGRPVHPSHEGAILMMTNIKLEITL